MTTRSPSALGAARWRASSATRSCTSAQVAPYLNGSKNLTFSRNTYTVPSVNGWYWLWDGIKYWNQWQSLGQDLSSTVSQ